MMDAFHDALIWVTAYVGIAVVISGCVLVIAGCWSWAIDLLLASTKRMHGYPYFLWVILKNRGEDEAEAIRRSIEAMPLEDRWRVFRNTINETRNSRNEQVRRELEDSEVNETVRDLAIDDEISMLKDRNAELEREIILSSAPPELERPVIWKAGWYATRLHAIPADTDFSGHEHHSVNSMCGASVYDTPPEHFAIRRLERGVPRCKHCERLLKQEMEE